MTTKTEEQIEQEAKELAVKTISKFHDGLIEKALELIRNDYENIKLLPPNYFLSSSLSFFNFNILKAVMSFTSEDKDVQKNGMKEMMSIIQDGFNKAVDKDI